MEFLKTIVDKFRLKELLAIIFLSALFITFIPSNLANTLQILDFRNTYQSYVSIGIIVPGAYYIFSIFNYSMRFIKNRIYNPEKTAIKYMKQHMTADEMALIIEKYYDRKNHSFKVSAMIDITDGRKAPLECKKIIYRASSTGYLTSFAYNLQPYALEFLNKNLQKGNIKITQDRYSWNLN